MDSTARKGLIYIHGRGGNAAEAEHYKPLFPAYDVSAFDYLAQTPWDATEEFERLFAAFWAAHDRVILVANSIGAYFAMHALHDRQIEQACFVSPIVDMGKLIEDMMQWAGVTERDLQEKEIIETSFGEVLSWKYLSWVWAHPVVWKVPTRILYGGKDNLQSVETIRSFAAAHGADVTVMEEGEHWFHTEEQMDFLDRWISR